MSAGLRAGAERGRAPGRRASSGGPPVRHLGLCGGVRFLTHGFLALAAVRSARVGGSRLARGTGCVASSSLGGGPSRLRAPRGLGTGTA